ncbi:MAG TPA: hypothetical protein DC024_11920 [Clostridiales bacterium]|nr:hypothetical protein [Clostridiales bacterium]
MNKFNFTIFPPLMIYSLVFGFFSFLTGAFFLISVISFSNVSLNSLRSSSTSSFIPQIDKDESFYKIVFRACLYNNLYR